MPGGDGTRRVGKECVSADSLHRPGNGDRLDFTVVLHQGASNVNDFARRQPAKTIMCGNSIAACPSVVCASCVLCLRVCVHHAHVCACMHVPVWLTVSLCQYVFACASAHVFIHMYTCKHVDGKWFCTHVYVHYGDSHLRQSACVDAITRMDIPPDVVLHDTIPSGFQDGLRNRDQHVLCL